MAFRRAHRCNEFRAIRCCPLPDFASFKIRLTPIKQTQKVRVSSSDRAVGAACEVGKDTQKASTRPMGLELCDRFLEIAACRRDSSVGRRSFAFNDVARSPANVGSWTLGLPVTREVGGNMRFSMLPAALAASSSPLVRPWPTAKAILIVASSSENSASPMKVSRRATA